LVDKLKKHSPTQTETEQSVVDQIPDNKMDDFIQGLVQLVQSRQKDQKTLQGNPEDQPLPARKEINRGPILRKYDA